MMRLSKAGNLRALAAAAAMLAASGVHAEERFTYLAGHAGKNQLEAWPARVDFGGVGADGALALKDGAHAGLALGREGEKYRHELEYQRGRIRIESIALGPVVEPSSASGHYDTLMLNGARTWRLSETMRLAAGLGAGWARVELPRAVLSTGCVCFDRARDDGWTYQGRLGAEYLVKPGHALSLQWTRLRLPGAASGSVPSVAYGHRWTSVASLGYRYTFR